MIKILLFCLAVVAGLASAPELNAQKVTAEELKSMVKTAIEKHPAVTMKPAVVDAEAFFLGAKQLGAPLDSAQLLRTIPVPARFGADRDVYDSVSRRWVQMERSLMRLGAPMAIATDVIRFSVTFVAPRSKMPNTIEATESTFTFQRKMGTWVLVDSYVSGIS